GTWPFPREPGHKQNQNADNSGVPAQHALGTVVAATKASNGLPQPGDEYDFYCSFPGFRAFCSTQGERLLRCMSQVMQYHGCRGLMKDSSKVTGLEDKFDMLVDSNDAILERVSILLDEASGVNRNQQPVLPAGLQPPQMIVSSWNRKAGEFHKRAQSETFRLLHAKNISRPQLKFREKIDNSNTPFVPKLFIKPNALKPLPEALTKSGRQRKERPEDLDVPAALADFIHQQRTQKTEQDMFAHPYQYELEHFSPPDGVLEKPELQMFRPIEETPFHFITTLDELVELNEKLMTCKEFALDLEHHSYRSFLGLTCLMQISTRTEDFIIDTLELRSDMNILNETFTDPAIVKVLHGADSDVEWLQRDFGLYLVNVFDTHQAARLLNLGRHSLDHLLKLYCNVDADKKYQLADWRIRPLPEEMIRYARDDTHYLLYIYDRVRELLWERGKEQPTQLQVVWQRSRDICLKKYIKPLFTDESYLDLYRRQKKHLDSQQLAAFRLLFAWRDKIARQEDEINLLDYGIIACCNPVPPLVRQQVNELHLLIQQAREMPLVKVGECDENEGNKKTLTTAQRKAQLIMESFENPFKMVKSSQWWDSDYPQEQANRKRERDKSEVGAETGAELPTQEKKRQKTPQKPEELEAPRQFTPFDYSNSNFKVFAGSSKSKQSQQFDPAKQAHTGKVWACHERRNRNVGNCVYPARGSLGGHMASPTSAECSLTGAQMQLPITSSCFVLLFLPIREELPWSPSDSLVFSHLFIHCSHLCLCTSQA
uniref:Exosome component 10 n=1 Tax=Zosterops lateralis melanops TaxID=1220523 RepID=A0A8D2NW18_ZOSLA